MNSHANSVPRIDPLSGSLGLPEASADELLASDWRSMPRVLFVDDEWEVVSALRRAFLGCPYRIHTTTSPELALTMFRDEPFDVIVADELMPGMLGSQLLAVIAREFPATARILLTGHGTVEAAARAVNDAGVVRLLLKPCPVEKLHEAIEAALRSAPSALNVRPHRRRIFLVSHSPTGTTSPGTRESMGASGAHPSAPPSGDPDAHADPVKNGWSANELVLHAQRVVDLQDETLLGYEISVRLQAASGRVHTIGNFISSAQHGVPLPSVDRWIVRQVLESIHAHRQILTQRGLTISLNIATGSFRDPDFVRFLNAELIAGRLSSRFLVEIRESALAKAIGNDEGLVARLSEMSCFTNGARLCIDGVSGSLWKLAPLKMLPVAMAKIDSRFVCDILTNRQSEALVRAAVDWGAQSGAQVVATGIDSVAIAERLHQLGVRYGQGSAVGRTESLLSTLAGLYY
jgi:EAL domain-containing protein (putative c-di-GMP-specific phosphodiesterase class I)/CheY-like chemotaxis protein